MLLGRWNILSSILPVIGDTFEVTNGGDVHILVVTDIQHTENIDIYGTSCTVVTSEPVTD